MQNENITVKFLARAEQRVLVLGQLGQHAAHPVLVVLVAVVHRLEGSRVNVYYCLRSIPVLSPNVVS